MVASSVGSNSDIVPLNTPTSMPCVCPFYGRNTTFYRMPWLYTSMHFSIRTYFSNDDTTSRMHSNQRRRFDNTILSITTDNNAQVHLSYLHMPLTLRHIRRLHITLRPYDTNHLSLRVLYHHLLISARSPLIPQDRYLSITMDNTIHTMTPNDTYALSTILHYLHLFINPSTGSPYLLYTFDGHSNTNQPPFSLRSDLPSQQVYPVVPLLLSNLDDIV